MPTTDLALSWLRGSRDGQGGTRWFGKPGFKGQGTDLATRNPMLPLRSAGEPPKRSAARW
jgi:hypothetical protein